MARLKQRSRRQVTVLLLLLVAGAFVVLDPGGRFSSRLRTVAAHVVAPSQSWLKSATLSLVGRRDAVADDLDRASAAELRQELLRAEALNARLSAERDALLRQLQDLRQISGALADYPLTLVPAGVLSSDYLLPDAGLRIDVGAKRGIGKGQWVVYRYLSRGQTSGVREGQGVITADGLAGLIDKTGPYFSQVKLITSPDCQLAARVMHWDAAARLWVACPDVGLTQGTGDGRTLRLLHVPATADVRAGDYVVTATTEAGLAQYLIIGRVAEVSRRPTDLTHTIVVYPQVNLSLLDQVCVLAPTELRRGQVPGRPPAK
jgi:cell shape-determining protein MreC